MEPFTLEHFKSEHFIPSVTDRDQLEAWKESGRKTLWVMLPPRWIAYW